MSAQQPSASAAASLQTGFARQKAGDFGGAVAAYESALRLDPDFHPAWANLGVVYRRVGRFEESATAYRNALKGAPSHAGLWGNLGNVLRDLGRQDEAIDALRRSLAIRPNSAQVWRNLAVSMDEVGHLDEAARAFDRAYALAPDDVEVVLSRCHFRLSIGNWSPDTWRDFEQRWHQPRMMPLHGLSSAPRWHGEDRHARRLLVIGEQGFGDTLLATRFLAKLSADDGPLGFLCQPELRRLLEPALRPLGIDVDDAAKPTPAHDLVIPIMDLIGRFCGSVDKIPPPLSLCLPAHPTVEWTIPAAQNPDALRIGIVWSGNVDFAGNARRAMDLAHFLPLAGMPGVQLYSLQLGQPREQLRASSAAETIVDLAPMIGDFADTAALLQQLDLVIQTDSAVAHLAGTLGIPVWNLLQTSPYSFYFRDRTDCPWYPSMRLFRQRKPGDWDGVLAEVRRTLEAERTALIRRRSS